VGQWRANEHLDFVVEGSYFGSKEKRARDRLHATTRQDGHTVSDVVLADDDRTVQSLTLSRAAGVDASAQSYYEEVTPNNYTTNAEMPIGTTTGSRSTGLDAVQLEQHRILRRSDLGAFPGR
jgi:iron complex outermembrane receptor protein